MSDNKRQGPLLYTQKFSTQPPSINMQTVYTSKQIKELEPEPEVESNPRRMAANMDDSPVPIQIDTEKKHKEKSHSSFKRVKGFKEMDLNERLDYLIKFPNVLPPVPCVFHTINRNYQGYLIELDEVCATIQLPDETTKEIPLNELKDIKMIGIKR